MHLLAGRLEVTVVDAIRPADVAHDRPTHAKFNEGSIVIIVATLNLSLICK